jgi:hypothetical protein
MDEWDGISTVNRNLTRAGTDHIRLILLMQLIDLLIVLKIWKNAGKDAVEFGYAR